MANEMLNKLSKKVSSQVKAEINSNVLGYITVVYYEKRKVDILYMQAGGGRRYIQDVEFPKGEDGVFTSSLETGDMVELSYRNNSPEDMFISSVYKKERNKEDMNCDKGFNLPRITNIF